MKTKILKLSLTAILLCLFIISCKKKVDEDYRPEFIGHWYGPLNNNYPWEYTLFIDSNSNANFSEVNDLTGTEHYLNGKARANDKHFKIGRFESFKIINYPHKIDTATSNVYDPYTGKKYNWEMTLEHPLFYSGSATYYKVDY